MACRLVLCGSSVYDQKKSFWSFEVLSECFVSEVATLVIGGCTVEVVIVDRIAVQSEKTLKRQLTRTNSCSIDSRSKGNEKILPKGTLDE